MKVTLPMKSLLVGLGTYAVKWLSSKPNRIKAINLFRELKRKINPSTSI